MKAPGPISEVREILNLYNQRITSIDGDRFEELLNKWFHFAKYIDKKYKLKYFSWPDWCKWYLKRIKCEEILK